MNTTLDSICRSYLLNTNRNTLHGYVRILKYLIDFLRKFSLKHSFLDKTVVLKLDQKKCVPFPEDFIMWSKIGWQSGDRIVAFERDNTINLNHEISADGYESPTVNIAFNNTQWPYSREITFNNFLNINGELGCFTGFGVGWNGIGYFRIDWRNREIQFSSDTPSDYQIYLEYKTNGVSIQTTSTIPEIAAKLGEDFIHWQVAHYKLGAAAAETEARRISYFREYDELIQTIEPINPAALQGLRARGFDVNKLVY